MKTIKELEEQELWSVSDLKVYLLRWNLWAKSGLGEAPNLLPQVIDCTIEALDKLERLDRK